MYKINEANCFRRYKTVSLRDITVRRQFIKNLALLQGLNLVIKPAWLLLIDRMAQNILGEEVYGQYYLILNLVTVANIIMDIGILNFNNTSVASDHSFFKSNFQALVTAKLLLSVIYFGLVLGIGISRHMPVNLLLVLMANQVIISFILYLRSNVNGLHYYAVDSLLSVSDKFFGIIICVAFYLSGNITIMYFAAAQLAASSVTLLIALALNIRYYALLPEAHKSKGLRHIVGLIKKSSPYALLFTLMGLYTRFDVMMMDWLLPDAEYHAGIYAQSFRLLDAAAMFAMLFSGLLLPMFSRQLSHQDDVKPLLKLAATMLLLVSITASTASVLFGERILDTLYVFDHPGQLEQSARVFTNIMSCFVPISLIFVYSTLLTAKGDLKSLNVFAVIALAINVGLNFVLIPGYQSYGASVSSLITQSVFALLCIGRCYRLFDLRFKVGVMAQYIGLLLCLAGIYFLVKGIGNIWVALALYCSLAFLFSVLLRLVDIGKFFLTFKGRQQ